MPRVKPIQSKIEPNFVMPKDLKPKDPDSQYIGEEPKFVTQPENRNLALISGLGWYNRFYGKKESKDFLISYMDFIGKQAFVKKLKTIPESNFKVTIGSLARMALRGLTLNDEEKQRVLDEVEKLCSQSKKSNDNSLTGSVKESTFRPNVQDIMKERAREAGGELEGLFDDFIKNKAPKDFNVKVMEELSKKNILPQHINILLDPWKQKQEEFIELQKGKDEQLNEAYSHFSKTQVKNILSFIDKVITDLNGYISVKKASKQPRVRKPVSVEKLTSKLKYCRQFTDKETKLDLVSLPPTKLHGASEAWVYDTAKRKMHHFVADDYSKTFTVKGNTLLGFDTKESEVKTLRKPNEQIKQLTGSKPAARKYFKEIKAVSTTPNGRFNPAMVILKAF